MTTIQETKQNLSAIFERMSFASLMEVRNSYSIALVVVHEAGNETATNLMTEILNFVDAYLSKLAILIDASWEE